MAVFTIAGLGNPGEEYHHTRHNVGRMMVEWFAKKEDFSEWTTDKRQKVTKAKGEVDGESVLLILPDAFMNNSGSVVAEHVKSVKAANRTTVIYDDLDLPLGTFKISFNRGSGGHRGVDSIIKKLKTREFVRIRVGISPETPSGKLRKPKGEDNVVKFIMKRFTPKEEAILKKVFKDVHEALITTILDGHEIAMGDFN